MTNRYPYQNPELSAKERAKDLLGRMTLEQKTRQLTGIMVSGLPGPEQFADGIGEVVLFMGPITPQQTAGMVRMIQDQVMGATEFGIPALVHAEALAGPMINGCLVYPTSVTLGATWDPAIVEDMADRIRSQMVNLGVRQALSPVLDLARDYRWGRTSEDFSSDPTLVSAMAAAYVKGLQGDDLKNGVAATAKHFLGYSMTEGGLNGTRTQTDWRDLRENFARPFEAAIRLSGLRSVMNSYSEYNGEPISSSKKLLTDLLRDDLGFEGIVVSDYTAINNLVSKNRTALDIQDAAVQCLKAGLDVELPNPDAYGETLAAAVREGLLEEACVDRSLLRMLTLKFELGLFEHPYGEFEEMDNSENDRKAKEAAAKAMTLTKNNGILPLTDVNRKIAVIGPVGNNLLMLNGSYSYPASSEMFKALMTTGKMGMEGVALDGDTWGVQKDEQKPDFVTEVDQEIRSQHEDVKTVFEALREIYPSCTYLEGCHVVDEAKTDFPAALKAAREADVVILTVGGKIGMMTECSAGESRDNVDITLPGRQMELLHRILEINPNVVIVHTDNKPLVDPIAYDKASAILEAWLPGLYGGNVIAETICGKNNPGGRLAVDVPRHVGQTPVYYYQHNGSRSDAGMIAINPDGYGTMSCSAQLPFGHGLSYTHFTYTNGTFRAGMEDGIPAVSVSVDVTNAGKTAGEEVVQLYGVDEVASVIRPQKELIGFARVSLKPGETKIVTLTFRLDQMAFENAEGNWVIEKGGFRFFIGRNCNEPVYETTYRQEKTVIVDHTKRGFFASSKIR